MRVVGKEQIEKWKKDHKSTAGVAEALDKWVTVVESATWKIPLDVKKTFNSADPIGTQAGKTLVVFDIKGNGFRLVALINFSQSFVFPKDFMDHAEYDKSCPITIEKYL